MSQILTYQLLNTVSLFIYFFITLMCFKSIILLFRIMYIFAILNTFLFGLLYNIGSFIGNRRTMSILVVFGTLSRRKAPQSTKLKY